MTLLITVFAAIIFSVLLYISKNARELKVGVLCYIYWGASLMWLVDAVFEYAKQGVSYFTPSVEEMLNDSFLGLAAVAFGLIIWLVILFIKDPKHVIRPQG